MKDGLVWVGMKNGINIFRFNYIGSNTRYEGVVAQDVLTIPGATTMLPGGILGVYYDLISVPFKEVPPEE